MKMIRIDEEQYSKLKILADSEGRSISNFLYQTLEAVLDEPEVGLKNIPKKFVEKGLYQTRVDRTYKDVLTEIGYAKEKLANDLEFCQDSDTRDKITKEANIQALWDEYHLLKGDN